MANINHKNLTDDDWHDQNELTDQNTGSETKVEVATEVAGEVRVTNGGVSSTTFTKDGLDNAVTTTDIINELGSNGVTVEGIRMDDGIIDDTAIIADTADPTAGVRIDAGSIATGVTRVMTAPNKDIDIAGTADITTDITAHAALTTPHISEGDVVSTTAAQTLTNKTIDYDLNTISNIPYSILKSDTVIGVGTNSTTESWAAFKSSNSIPDSVTVVGVLLHGGGGGGGAACSPSNNYRGGSGASGNYRFGIVAPSGDIVAGGGGTGGTYNGATVGDDGGTGGQSSFAGLVASGGGGGGGVDDTNSSHGDAGVRTQANKQIVGENGSKTNPSGSPARFQPGQGSGADGGRGSAAPGAGADSGEDGDPGSVTIFWIDNT